MTLAIFVLRIVLILVIAHIAVGCVAVPEPSYSHHPDAACTISCAKNFPRTGGGHSGHP
jgi:hypothetical protein